jgi:hypothetical protein
MINTDAELGIELADAKHFDCPDCGRQSESVHGFLFDTTGETAVYFVGYTPGHPERHANIVLSVGGWGEGMEQEDRKAIAMEARFGDLGVELTYPPPRSSPWFGEDFLGKMREPEEMSDEDRASYRTLALAAVEKDPRVVAYRKSG